MKYENLNKIVMWIKGFDLGHYNKYKRIAIDLLMIGIGIFWIYSMINTVTSKQTTYEATFIDCVDGDTVKLKVNYKAESVRLLAIDTPEIGSDPDYYGKEASDYSCALVTGAKKIKVELDSNADKYDKYGRLLAWVFIDGQLLQAELVENGYAKVAYLYDDYTYTEDIKILEDEAQANKIGIWSDENPDK